jgi:hypothetical protein
MAATFAAEACAQVRQGRLNATHYIRLNMRARLLVAMVLKRIPQARSARRGQTASFKSSYRRRLILVSD